MFKLEFTVHDDRHFQSAQLKYPLDYSLRQLALMLELTQELGRDIGFFRFTNVFIRREANYLRMH